MGDLFIEQPAINSPYTYPARRWELDDQGQPTQKRVADTRPDNARLAGTKRRSEPQATGYGLGHK